MWKTKDEIAFKDVVLSYVQRLKTSFVFLFWSETKLSILDGPFTIAEFIIGSGVCEVGVVLCVVLRGGGGRGCLMCGLEGGVGVSVSFLY